MLLNWNHFITWIYDFPSTETHKSHPCQVNQTEHLWFIVVVTNYGRNSVIKKHNNAESYNKLEKLSSWYLSDKNNSTFKNNMDGRGSEWIAVTDWRTMWAGWFLNLTCNIRVQHNICKDRESVIFFKILFYLILFYLIYFSRVTFFISVCSSMDTYCRDTGISRLWDNKNGDKEDTDKGQQDWL